MGKYGKKNHVSVNPLDANICLMAMPKQGKTTLMKEVAERLVGEDGYLMLEMFRENGAKYIENIVYEDVPTWESFVDIIDDIVDNRTTDYKNLKVVFIDTLDNALQLAEQESIRLWNKANPTKRTDSINAAWGGFMKGQDKAMDLLQEQLFKLRSVNIAFTIIAHIRQTTITDPVSLETYQQITSDISQRYFNQLKKNIDLVAVGYIDREMTKIKDKSGKTVNKVVSESRRIKFRDSNYTVDAGGRFSHIVDEIPFEPDAFIKAITDAINYEIEKGGVSVEKRKDEDKKRESELMNNLAKAETERKENKKAEDDISILVERIMTFFSENKDSMDVMLPVLKLMKSLGYTNPKDITLVEDANKILELC